MYCKKIKKIIDIAIEYAKFSDGPNYKLGAVVFKGNKIISKGRNFFCKTHPKSLNSKKTIHAEFDAIRKIKDGKKNKKMDLLVVRKTKNGIGVSKPCSSCMELIKNSNISKVYFINEKRQLDVIEV